MAKRPTAEQLFAELLDRYGLEIATAFMAAIEDVRAGVDLQRVIAALEAGDLSAAIAGMHIEPSAYGPLLDAIRASYTAGGTTVTTSLPVLKDVLGAVMVVRFDARNPRAEQWLQSYSSNLVTRIVDDQRAAVREALTKGMEKDHTPRTVALDVVGRISRATGKREGGIIGLTAPQEAYVRSAAAELASGDPATLKHYLTRTRRDKRFDRAVTKAIREGKPVPAATAAKAVTQYKNRLLKLRGDTVGRKEAMTSLQAAKLEAYVQAADSGAVSETAIRRTWRDASDLRVRHTHDVLGGQTVGLREPFISPSGAFLMYPGDPMAPASETIGCRCDVEYRIDFLSNLG